MRAHRLALAAAIAFGLGAALSSPGADRKALSASARAAKRAPRASVSAAKRAALATAGAAKRLTRRDGQEEDMESTRTPRGLRGAIGNRVDTLVGEMRTAANQLNQSSMIEEQLSGSWTTK